MSVSDYALGLLHVRDVHEKCGFNVDYGEDGTRHVFEECPYLAEFRRWVRADQGATDGPSAPPDMSRLARALIASGLIDRYSTYAHQAHPVTMHQEVSDGELATSWAASIIREYAATEPVR